MSCILKFHKMLLKAFFSVFCSCVVIICSSATISSFTTCNKSCFHPVIISSSVLLPCPGFIGVDRVWTYNTEILNVLAFIIQDHFQGSVRVFENFSLNINEVSYSHEGLFQCGSNGSVFVEHSLHLIGLYF